MWIAYSGSTGTDYSANAAAVPIAGYGLLLTIPARPQRNHVAVQNQSTDVVQLVCDDGAGGNQTSIMLAAAAAAGGAGQYWESYTFKGRVRVYAATGTDRVAARDE